MKNLMCFVMVAMLGLSMMPVSVSAAGNDTTGEPTLALSEILDLWRNENYARLFERTVPSPRLSREKFTEALSSASRKPACCWEKLQEVDLTDVSDRSATVRAKVGMEQRDGSTVFTTRHFKLKKVGVIWKIASADILSLSGSTKRSHYRRHGRAL
jgi:hypothetical protein